MAGEKILVVEDDREIRELVSMYLESESYTMLGVGNGAEAILQLERFRPDLVILDVLLPDMDGMQVCRQVRQVSNIPIVFLSCQPSNHHIIAGLEAGGDDYMVKPFDPAVLLARVRANLRRAAGLKAEEGEAQTRRFGCLEINLESLDVRLDGQQVPLYAKELQLLLFFSKHPNIVFSARHLYEQVWGWNSDGDERTVMVHISNLRKKIESEETCSPYIQTVRGFGYKFVPRSYE